jgi:hypothetical protein
MLLSIIFIAYSTDYAYRIIEQESVALMSFLKSRGSGYIFVFIFNMVMIGRLHFYFTSASLCIQ